MIYDENGFILNEGLFQKIKDKFSKKDNTNRKEEPITLTNDELKKINEVISKIRKIIAKSLSKNIKTIENEYSGKIVLKRTLADAFSVYSGDFDNSDSRVIMLAGDIYELSDMRDDNGTFYDIGMKLCELINRDLQKAYPSLELKHDDGDWDEYFYSVDTDDLIKLVK